MDVIYQRKSLQICCHKMSSVTLQVRTKSAKIYIKSEEFIKISSNSRSNGQKIFYLKGIIRWFLIFGLEIPFDIWPRDTFYGPGKNLQIF